MKIPGLLDRARFLGEERKGVAFPVSNILGLLVGVRRMVFIPGSWLLHGGRRSHWYRDAPLDVFESLRGKLVLKQTNSLQLPYLL